MPKPKSSAFDVNLTDAELGQLADDLVREITDAFDARGSVIDAGGLIDYADWYYEQGKSNPNDLPFPGAADLTSYIICENVDAMRARLMDVLFGARPLGFVEGWGQDAKKAPAVEAFMDWQLRKSDFVSECGKTIHGALIEDCYILEVSEKIETRRVVEEIDVALELNEAQAPVFENGKPRLKLDEDGEPIAPKKDPMTGQSLEPAAKVRRSYTKTRRLGPQYDPISMRDFVFLPGHAKGSSQVWGYAYRIFERIPTLKERVEDGIYDEKAVEKLGTSSDREGDAIPNTVDTVASQEGPSVEKELFQVSLKRDLDGDGREEWYIATVSLKTRELLRLKLDTFAMKVGRPRCVPFVLFPRRDSVYGYSYAFTKLLTLAEEHTALRNMKADRGNLATNKPIKQLANGLWDPNTQPMGVGAVITVRDMNEVQEMQIADVPASIVEQEHAIMAAKERVGGLSDSAVGVLSTEKRTLGENRLVAGGSAVRVKETVGYLHLGVADVMKLAHAIWVETLRENKNGIDAPAAVTQSLKNRGGDYAEFSGAFTAEMLAGDFQFVPYGSVDNADPQKQRNDFDGFVLALTKLAQLLPGFRAILANPEANKAILEQLLRSYDVRDRQPFMGALMAPPVPPAAGGMGAEAMGTPEGGSPSAAPGMPPELMAMLAAAGGPPQGAPNGQ